MIGIEEYERLRTISMSRANYTIDELLEIKDQLKRMIDG
jgi:hypothetical protein